MWVLQMLSIGAKRDLFSMNEYLSQKRQLHFDMTRQELGSGFEPKTNDRLMTIYETTKSGKTRVRYALRGRPRVE